MNRIIEALAKRVKFVKDLNDQVRDLNDQVRDLNDQVRDLNNQVGKEGVYPAGHYYSPIPSEDDVLMDIKCRGPFNEDLLGINLNKAGQYLLLNEYMTYYNDLFFPEEQTPKCRYYYKNEWFSYSDAIFLYCFLRKFLPKKIIEVGSGYSSAVMLDTIDNFFPKKPEITFIDPYPDRLIGLLKEEDKKQIRVIDKKIQEVSSDILLELESGDFLFIDSSHVVKSGNDLLLLMFDVLPRLRPGVFVHFHDVFYPFNYPSEWLAEGRYWNENYFLRAFLSYSTEWSICFFSNFVNSMFGSLIKENMPLCTKNPGGSLYIRREQKG